MPSVSNFYAQMIEEDDVILPPINKISTKTEAENITTEPKMEPILDPKNYRMQLYPIQYNDIWELYRKSIAAFWVPDEIRFSEDLNDWAKLDLDEQNYILMVLAFFSASDFIVNENLDNDFCESVTPPELKMFYHAQEMIEDIHTQTYQLLINTLVSDAAKRDQLFSAVRDIPTIKKKADWARSWIQNGSWVERLVVFACVEGLFFSSAFCSIFWCKKRGLMPGLSQSNELISRDEGLHYQMSCLLYRNYIVNKLETSKLLEIIRSAVDIEKEFVNDCLPYRLNGMNAGLMCQYVEFMADFLARQLGIQPIYNTENPFPWMSLISLENKTNFFEKGVTEYKKFTNTTEADSSITFDDEF